MQAQLDFDFGNAKFWEHHRNNPHVYKALKKIIFRAIEKGYKHFSIDMAYQILRWETGVTSDDADYKLNNNFRSFYGRLFVLDYPQYSDLFSFRKSKSNSLLNK